MYDVPHNLKTRFGALLDKKGIPKHLWHHYQKWLRYYCDFCHRYRFPETESDNLRYFIKKLQEKNQTEAQQDQAFHSISICYELLNRESPEKKERSEPLPGKRKAVQSHTASEKT